MLVTGTGGGTGVGFQLRGECKLWRRHYERWQRIDCHRHRPRAKEQPFGLGGGNYGLIVDGANSQITSSGGSVSVTGIGNSNSEAIRQQGNGKISSEAMRLSRSSPIASI